jgi:hypothetical protein
MNGLAKAAARPTIPSCIPNVAIDDALARGLCAIVVLVVVVALAWRTASTWPVTVTRPRGLGDSPPDAAPVRPWRIVAPWTPVGASVLLPAVVEFSYRVTNNRSESPPWTAVVAAATHECQKPGMGDYDYRHVWWQVRTLCSRV